MVWGSWGFVCVVRATRLSRLMLMSSCLDDSRSCSGVGSGGRFTSEVNTIA